MKIVLDALKGICYEDDDQICNVIFSKKYGEISKIAVAIREIIGR
jgi:Holliday junction resolvase RusA-like endonuclease